MKRTSLFCLVSAVVGALAATAYHQTALRREANAQEPGRGTLLREVEAPPLPPNTQRRTPVFPDRGPGSTAGSGLEEFAPEERTNIQVYEKANRSVVHITTKSAQRELL